MRKRKIDPAKGAAEDPAGNVDSLERGLEILRAFRGAGSALTLNQLALQSGLPRATAKRLVDTLTAQGFLAPNSDGVHFEPDVASLLIGHAYLSSQPLVRHAVPVMQALANSQDVHVLLAVQERSELLCLAHCAGAGSPALNISAGTLLPLATTALGRAWLWAQAPAEQGELMARIRAAGGEQGSRMIAGLYAAFQSMETQGYCVSIGEWEKDVNGIATAIPLPDGRYAALGCTTVGLGAPAERISSLASELTASAASIKDAVARNPR